MVPGSRPPTRPTRSLTAAPAASGSPACCQQCAAFGTVFTVTALCTVHRLRHTCGTEIVEERYPFDVVQKTLGHADPRSTQVFADMSDLQLRHEFERHRRSESTPLRMVEKLFFESLRSR